MQDATHSFLHYVETEHARHRYENDPWKLAHSLGIRVIAGESGMGSAGPPAVIALARDLHVSRRRYTLHHEICHVLMQREGLEDAICAEVDEDDAGEHLEAVTNYAAGTLLMHRALLAYVLSTHGDRPEAIVNLSKAAGASISAALRRVVYADPEASRGAFMTSGKYITDAAACNLRLPFWTWDRVPEAELACPEVELLSLGRGRTLGVVAW